MSQDAAEQREAQAAPRKLASPEVVGPDDRRVQVHGRPDLPWSEYVRELGVALAGLAQGTSRPRETPVLPDPTTLADLLAGLAPVLPSGPNELAELLGPFWTGSRTAEALGTSRQNLFERRNAGSLLGVKDADGKAVFYPVAQFQRRADGKVEVRPALVLFMRVLRDFDPWIVGVALHTRAPELDGLTPLAWVRDRPHASDPEHERLVSLARALAHEWSAGSTGVA